MTLEHNVQQVNLAKVNHVKWVIIVQEAQQFASIHVQQALTELEKLEKEILVSVCLAHQVITVLKHLRLLQQHWQVIIQLFLECHH